MDKKDIISILNEIGTFLELKGENPFKCRAYHNAARVLDATPEDIDDLIKTKKLGKLQGIGEALQEKITELAEHGKLKYYDDLKKSIPSGLLEMIQLAGVGPKKAKHLYEELGIKSIGELEYACQENRLLKIGGFGEKSQNNILKAIRFFRKSENRFLFPDAHAEAIRILDILKKDKNVIEASIAGSLRRRKEIVRDIDFVVATKNPAGVMKKFVSLPNVDRIISHGETKASTFLKAGIQADIRCVTGKEYPFTLHHFTGSKEHNVALRSRAQTMGIKMNEYGLFKGKKLLPCKNEEEIFKRLGLDYIPPELRENQGEIEAASIHKLPHLIDWGDLCGTFHVHSLYSDGTATIEAMASAAKKAGLQYVGISDHSQSAFYAHGMKAADIKKQHREIDELNKGFKNFRIFKGVESDILADGSLDYDGKILDKFEFVIASVHSRFQMKEEEMTARIIKALKNPHTTILGHMTGRLLLSREPYAVNIRKIIDTAVEHNKIIELNCNPYRCDIDWRHLQYAKKQGLKICINPDAHRIEGITDLELGIGLARKGGMGKKDVINTMSLKEMEKFLRFVAIDLNS
ncbi:MAG: DNA polymerase/3'-5' exonuclease PolX [Deltaproteobacteria bacterium]|nr:DNA polymerase/3'-5' exonuclease PolX [Deltaproteobacteria bacterium]